LKDRSLNLEKVDGGTIYSSIEELKFKIQSLEENSIVAEESIKQIGWRFLTLEKAFDDRQDPIEIANIQRSLPEIENSVSKMSATAAMTKSEYVLELAKLELASNNIYLSIEQIESKIHLLTDNYSTIDIYDRIGDLDASLSDLHDYNLSLNNKIESYDRYEIPEIVDAIILDKKIDDLIKQRVDQSVREKFDPVEKILPRQYSHDLVCDREKSRQIFLEALSQSEQRLILVCPWLTEYAINLDVQASIRAALDRGVLIDIGWGNLKDVNNDRSRLSKEILLNSKAKKWGGYGAVDWVYELQAEYADLLNLKILGTHEKFLVCDRKFAMLGSHNYMTSNTSSSEREVGIKTDNPELIEQLIELFDSPKYREGQRVDLQ
jgi:phosphatidylserine/phosphatidylglycerophosphate/cardiolipin synthase-like enzyme